jgi:hypothetical protein
MTKDRILREALPSHLQFGWDERSRFPSAIRSKVERSYLNSVQFMVLEDVNHPRDEVFDLLSYEGRHTIPCPLLYPIITPQFLLFKWTW